MQKEGQYAIVLGRSKRVLQQHGLKATVLLGKQFVKMIDTTRATQPVYLDLDKAHVMFVCGKRGSGKCLTGDALVTLADGRLKRIDELQRDEVVLSLGKKLKISESLKQGFYQREVSSLLKLTLRSGKQIKLTPEHPLLTMWGWQAARQLGRGSRIATPRVSPSFGDRSMEEYKIKLLAYLLAEGHLSNNLVLFANIDQTIVREFIESIHSFDDSLQVLEHSKRGCYRVSQKNVLVTIEDGARNDLGRFTSETTRKVSKPSLRVWLETLGVYGKLARQRSLPECVFTLPKHQLALFLNRLFSCDGTIYRKKAISRWQIAYCSSSHEFIMQVHHLLLRFGILSKVREKKKVVSYELEVSLPHTKKFLQEVGFFAKKQIRQERALREIVELVHNPNVDTIPKELWEWYRPQSWAECGRSMGYAHPNALRESIRYSPSRQKLLQIAKVEENTTIQEFAESDIFWDEIMSIEELQGQCTVYDISVPKNHNFIANDIIVHNSYTMGAIAEGIASATEKKRISVILLDTMGIYWTMKYPNRKPAEEQLLKEWSLEGKGFENIKIFTPVKFHEQYKAEGRPSDEPFSIRPAELNPEQWALAFDLDPGHRVAVFIESVLLKLREEKSEYAIPDIVLALRAGDESEDVKRQAVTRFESAMQWGLFSDKATPMRDLAAPGQVTVIDLSCYTQMANGWKIKSLALGLVSQKMFVERMAARKDEEFSNIKSAMHYILEEEETPSEMPLVWLFIDEAHEFLPNQGKTGATQALLTLLREGRQPGIAMVMATQQPGKIHTDAMTQSDIVLAHRLTAKIDTDALGVLFQSYLRQGLDGALRDLPRLPGAALIVDDENERMFPVQVRPRVSWHGGSAPGILKDVKKAFDF